MRLTKQSNYAVRTLMYCAANPDKLSRISDVAKAYSISELFLFKIIKPLVAGGLVVTLRGRNGGIKLARPAEEITLLEAIKLAEENFMMAECFDGRHTDCPLVDHCAFNGALNAALNAFFETLEQFTIADLVTNRDVVAARLGLGMDRPMMS